MADRLIDLAFVCAAAAVPVVIPMLVTLLYQAIGGLRDQRQRDQALMIVRAAQQAIPDTSDRYAYVAAMLAQRFPSLKADQVQALIEAAVHQVKATQPQALEVLPVRVSDVDPNSDPIAFAAAVRDAQA